MKARLLCSFAALLLPVLSNAATLLPTDHPACTSYVPEQKNCDRGLIFVVDQFGRCGCLYSDEFFDAKSCTVGRFRCNDDKAEIFSTLSTFKWQSGKMQKVTIGCGCFTTDDPDLRDS